MVDRGWSLIRGANDRPKLVAGLLTEHPRIFPTFPLSGLLGAFAFSALFLLFSGVAFSLVGWLKPYSTSAAAIGRLADLSSRANYFEKLFVSCFLERSLGPRILAAHPADAENHNFHPRHGDR